LGRPVLDQTGLKGNYNFDLKWTPDVNSPGAMPGPSPAAETAPPDASGPSIFTALQEQLGLKLESTRGLEEAITIVHIEKPSLN
jgi:bla regulator protein blaR1